MEKTQRYSFLSLQAAYKVNKYTGTISQRTRIAFYVLHIFLHNVQNVQYLEFHPTVYKVAILYYTIHTIVWYTILMLE